MASQLTPLTPVWHDSLTIIDPDDPVQGGVDGIDNIPHIELAQNDVWLKTELIKALERITVLEGKGGVITPIPTTSTGGATTPTNSTGTWSFLSSKSPKLNAYSQNPNDEWLIFTSQPIYSYYYKMVFQSDLPKVKRLPYEPYGGVAANAAYTADKFTNRVLVYVAKQGEQPDYSQLPLMNTYDNKNPIVVNEAYFEVDEEGKVYFVRGKESWTGVVDSSGRIQAERLGIIKSGQVSPEQHWDTYYVFLLDEKADNKLSEEQIKAQQWGTHHIEKVTMCTRWDVGVGAYTVQQGSGTTAPDTSEGGNMASIEAGN